MLAERGIDLWVIGGPNEKGMATEIAATGGPRVRDLTGHDLRNGILAIGGGHHCNIERLRSATRRGCDRNADTGNFRADQPLSLGALERARRDDLD